VLKIKAAADCGFLLLGKEQINAYKRRSMTESHRLTVRLGYNVSQHLQ
jgi:hypothetical protein